MLKNVLGVLLLVTGMVITPFVVKKFDSGYSTTIKHSNIVVQDLELPKSSNISDNAKPIKLKPSDLDLILESKNTLILRTAVSEASVNKLQNELLEMSMNLSKNTPIYLVLDTPGGDVFAGLNLIDNLRAIPQKIYTVTLFAASMGFQIVQNSDVRYITNQGTLMSHRAKLGGLGGQLDGELESRYAMIKRKVDYLDAVASKRMGITIKEYKSLILNEYWVHGFDSTGDKAADKVVNLRCGKSLSGTKLETVNTFFGPVKVKFSECPIIRGPISVNYNNVDKNKLSEIKDVINKMLNYKNEYVKDLILTNKHSKYIK